MPLKHLLILFFIAFAYGSAFPITKLAIRSNKPAVVDVDVDPSALYSIRRDSSKHRQK